MAINDILGDKVAEGKTKIVCAHRTDPGLEIIYFKNAITAGDGLKRDVIEGKGAIDWRTNRNIMRYLKRSGVPMAYVESPEQRYTTVRKLDRIVKLEIVTRRVATGSVLELGFEEGLVFDPLKHQFFYKDDFLHDPLLDDEFIDIIGRKKEFNFFSRARALSSQVFVLLEDAFAKQRHQYMDHKIEVGVIYNGADYNLNSEVVLIDEITAGSFRLWPYAEGVQRIDLSQSNVMGQLDKAGMKDKQVYRDGADLAKVKTKFEQIAGMTSRFPSGARQP